MGNFNKSSWTSKTNTFKLDLIEVVLLIVVNVPEVPKAKGNLRALTRNNIFSLQSNPNTGIFPLPFWLTIRKT